MFYIFQNHMSSCKFQQHLNSTDDKWKVALAVGTNAWHSNPGATNTNLKFLAELTLTSLFMSLGLQLSMYKMQARLPHKIVANADVLSKFRYVYFSLWI